MNLKVLTACLLMTCALTSCASYPRYHLTALEREITSGQEIPISWGYFINSDCSRRAEPFTFSVSGARHGTIRRADEAFYPDIPADQPTAPCNAKRVSGIRVYYKSAPEFVGIDHVVVTWHPFEAGGRDVFDIKVDPE
jgi:hypothetical protein